MARRRRAPTEYTARTNDPVSSIERSGCAPILVMIRIEAATYGESLISTPSWEMLLPSGPIQNGTTYMVRAVHGPVEDIRERLAHLRRAIQRHRGCGRSRPG